MTRAATADTAVRDDEVGQVVRHLFGRDWWYMLLWTVQIAAAALFTPITTRVLGADTFGQVAAAVAVMQVLFAVAALRLQAAIQRFYAEPDGRRKAGQLLSVTIVTAVGVGVLADLTGPYWSTWLGFGGYAGAVRLAVWWAVAGVVTDACLAMLRSQDRLVAFGSVSLLQSFVAEGVCLVLVLTIRNSAAMYVFGHLAVQLVALAVALSVARPRRFRLADLPFVMVATRYAAPLIPAALSAFVLSTADRLMLQRSLGAVEVGRYQVAYNLGCLPITLLGVLNTVWMPRIFALESERTRISVLAASRDAIYRLLVPVVIGLAVAAPILLRIWAPASYDPESLVLVVGVVAISVLPFAMQIAYSRTLLLSGDTSVLAWGTGIAAATNIGLNLVLIPTMGILGAAIATFIGYTALGVFVEARAQRVLRIPPTARRVGVLVAAAMCLALGNARMPVQGWWLAVRAFVAVGCAVWALMVIVRTSSPDSHPRLTWRGRESAPRVPVRVLEVEGAARESGSR